MIPGWEHFEHEADIGVRGFGATMAEAFEQAALAMSGTITEISKIEPEKCLDVSCEAPDREVLLVDWLNELVYHMARQNMLFATFDVSIDGHCLTAKVCGESADAVKHQPAVEVKGATFTELKVYQNPDKTWVAQCVIDV
ncbi:MAG: archease [Gammaproteobacteria bacterium]